VAEGDVRWVLLDFESVTDIDPTASEALAEAISLLHERDKIVGIARASAPVRTLLDLYGLSPAAGVDYLFASNREALAAYLAEGTEGQRS
jgi:MFS superfamily sulfate permease-like transporter